jgi:hypothetical protein
MNCQHAHRIARAGGPDQRVDLAFAEQLLGQRHALRRIAGVVEHHVLDVEVADLLRQQRNGVLLRDADEGNRAGRRGDDADLDLGMHRQGWRPASPAAVSRVFSFFIVSPP